MMFDKWQEMLSIPRAGLLLVAFIVGAVAVVMAILGLV